ncbi:MAG: hypothetical protein R3E66_12205 [bacterium]
MAALLVVATASPAHAQRDASLEKLLKDANLEGRAADTSPIPKSNVAEVNLQVHWQLWKRVVGTNKPGWMNSKRCSTTVGAWAGLTK